MFVYMRAASRDLGGGQCSVLVTHVCSGSGSQSRSSYI